MTTQDHVDADLDRRLRETLREVAATVSDPPPVSSGAARKRPRRRLVAAVTAVGIAVPAAATATYLNTGSEYVESLPPDGTVASGTVEGVRYWITTPHSQGGCDGTRPGAEFVREDWNTVGEEWGTIVVTYGYGGVNGPCEPYEPGPKADPARIRGADSGSVIEDSWFVETGVHPDVTALRVTADGDRTTVPVHRLNGAGYTAFAVPIEAGRYTVAAEIDGHVVPGSALTADIPMDAADANEPGT